MRSWGCWRQESGRSDRGRSKRRRTVADEVLVVSNQNRCETVGLITNSYIQFVLIINLIIWRWHWVHFLSTSFDEQKYARFYCFQFHKCLFCPLHQCVRRHVCPPNLNILSNFAGPKSPGSWWLTMKSSDRDLKICDNMLEFCWQHLKTLWFIQVRVDLHIIEFNRNILAFISFNAP